MVQEYKDHFKKAKELDSEIKEIDKEYQWLMKPVKIKKIDKVFRGGTQSHEASITNDKDPFLHSNGFNKVIKSCLKQLLIENERLSTLRNAEDHLQEA